MYLRPQSFAPLRETNGTDLAAYLRLDCRATLAKACDADLEHCTLSFYIPSFYLNSLYFEYQHGPRCVMCHKLAACGF
jgi:hypothetical protein